MQQSDAQVLIYDRIDGNRRNTWLLLVLFFLVVAGACTAVGIVAGLPPGWSPVIIVVVLVYAAVSYFFSSTIALGVAGARGPVLLADEPRLFRTVENLCIGLGMPMPQVYLIEDGAMNAFATGRDPQHAAIAVTRGLLDKLDDHELEGVVAHELSHIANRDSLLMTTTVVLVGSLVLLSDLVLRMTWYGAGSRRGYRDKNNGGALLLMVVALIGVVLAPIAARVISFALSRQREYLADASGALLTRYPEGLASALEKIRSDTDPLDSATKATEPLYFVSPLLDHASALNNLFATHPPLEERIRRLRAM